VVVSRSPTHLLDNENALKAFGDGCSIKQVVDSVNKQAAKLIMANIDANEICYGHGYDG